MASNVNRQYSFLAKKVSFLFEKLEFVSWALYY